MRLPIDTGAVQQSLPREGRTATIHQSNQLLSEAVKNLS